MDDEDLYDDWRNDVKEDVAEFLEEILGYEPNGIELHVSLEKVGSFDFYETITLQISDRSGAEKILPFFLFFGAPFDDDDFVIELENVRLIRDVTSGSGDAPVVTALKAEHRLSKSMFDIPNSLHVTSHTPPLRTQPSLSQLP